MKRLIPTLKGDGVSIEFIMLIRTVLAATKEIAFRVSQGELSGILGSTLDENIQGETQKKLDVLSNQLIKDMLLADDQVRAIASEEEDNVVVGTQGAPYIVAFDPLDGSSNIDINGQIGTIFTIYPARDDVPADSPLQFQQPGKNQLCAGYVLYGPATMLVMTTGGPTRCYTLDLTHGGFLLTQEELSVPTDTKEFAINMANSRFWADETTQYVNDLIQGEEGPLGKRYNMRWNAAMVGDIHRVLTRGGIFMYPNDNRDPKKPAKLRLLYEANPMAMLIENAGGKAYANKQRILDIMPDELHQRVPVQMGSANEVETCISYYD
ncbi:class 1 fructose-bisphosphatase [Saccharobesus litoralis]|uniref:Fructose-1,6-bisphosphatase class 1 n=1 Tax=Saccharobesus litoralis TaxID=2172099 RepID=A0A2S0VMH2_9ALTE|nr:class 1 fructose-bisphosphatase [Saccharobesus litoralis]AWB65421.1 class 1 fructose-bisphosphatase [Saccharobesus litoralis]